jgi:hypothetical protein
MRHGDCMKGSRRAENARLATRNGSFRKRLAAETSLNHHDFVR